MGVIEQLETAAEAKKRNPKKPLIQRELQAIDTPATCAEPAGHDAVYLLCLHPVGTTGAPR